jgi:hypothetical protein
MRIVAAVAACLAITMFASCKKDEKDRDFDGAVTITPNVDVVPETELTATYSGVETVTWQWKKDDVAVSGATANKYKPSEAGSYSATASAKGFNDKTSAAVEVKIRDLKGTIPSLSIMCIATLFIQLTMEMYIRPTLLTLAIDLTKIAGARLSEFYQTSTAAYHVSSVIETPSFLIFEYLLKMKRYSVFFNKKTNTVKEGLFQNDIFNSKIIFYMALGDKLVGLAQPHEIELGDTSLLSSNNIGMLNSISQSDNPILVIIDLKED